MSEEALQIAVKRKAKGKEEKERYTHLNAEFQRIARRDKKAFLSDQCQEIEENSRMGKTRDLFKKTREKFKIKSWLKTQQWLQDWKRSVFIPIPKKGSAKEGSNCFKIALIPHAWKIIPKILQAGLHQYLT